MTPYYQDDWVTIYHGDCCSILAGLPERSVDVFIADPPYGTRTNQRDEWMVGEFSNVLPIVLPELHRVGVADAGLYAFTSWKWMADWIYRCSPYFRMQNFLVWDKGKHSGTFGAYSWQFHWEGIFYGIKGPRPIRRYQPDVLRSSEVLGTAMQKPISVLEKLITASTDDGQLVLDPFLGTGSTLVAAKLSGRKAIGIEIEEKYCEIAARRMAQEVLAL